MNGNKLSFGISYTDHRNQPSIIERDRFGDPDDQFSSIDTTYRTNEWVGYMEHNLNLSKKLEMNYGLRFINYQNEEFNYSYFQPRLNFSFSHKSSLINLSYARLTQFMHLLSNPGPGLPSDLWVPSTQAIPPELSHNFALDYKRKFKFGQFGGSLFYRSFNNLIEYSSASDIIYSIIIDVDVYQIQVNNESFENRISIGQGRAYGLEAFYNYKDSKHKLDIAYSFNKSKRFFDDIDDGEAFPYRYDRPHSIAINYQYKLTKNSQIGINWVYGTGNAYTIYDIQQLGPNGETILQESSRNNFRLEDFHHLDLHYSLRKKFDSGLNMTFNLGIYNVYNRLNPFYEYLSQSSSSEVPELVKFAIYPILPRMSFNFTW